MVSDFPVDAVVTWVDGNDPSHLAKRIAAMETTFSKAEAKGSIPAGKQSTRFSDNGELIWCLYSIRKNAPWLRTIYLVTDNQSPKFLSHSVIQSLGVCVIDHTHVFRGYESALPNFNSQAIETMLWRIDGLSDRFVYFNDDVFLMKPVKPEFFFTDDKVVLLGHWQPIRPHNGVTRVVDSLYSQLLLKLFCVNRTQHLTTQMRTAELANFKSSFYRAPHIAHPMRVQTLSKYFEEHSSVLTSNIRMRFRNRSCFWPISLANHLEIRNETAALRDFPESSMISGENPFHRNGKLLMKLIKEPVSPFLCLQAFERFPKDVQKRSRDELNRLFKIE